MVAAAAVLSGAAVGGDMVAIDEDHDLTTTSEIDNYAEHGVATAEVAYPDLTLTIAESSSDVGLDGWSFDGNKRYLRIEYHETIERTIRLFVPAEYWHPASAEIDSIDENATAELRPTSDGRHTAVTTSVEEGDDLVFIVPKETNLVFWTRDRTRETINETLGYEPPRVSTGGEWSYIESSELENNSVPLDSTNGVTVQYDAADEHEEDPRWRSVPRCSRGTQDVCTYTVDGKDDTIMVLAQTEDPPQVRYKPGTDPREEIGSSFGEIGDIFGGALDGIFDIFRGGGDEQ